jgi:hypothetical protein
MGDNEFLQGQDVHCVFPVSEPLRAYILEFKERYRIRLITFSSII